MLSTLISALSLLSIFHHFSQANENSWKWTNWVKCEDNKACDYETQRYCKGDPTGRQCGNPPHSHSLYYRSLFGCPGLPTGCQTWSTLIQTNCERNACDYIVLKECDTIPSCFLTYLYTCNSELYIDCVGQWSEWKMKPPCKNIHVETVKNITLRRECQYEGKSSVKCGGNIKNNTFQEKQYSGKIKNVTCDYGGLNMKPVFSTVSTSTRMMTSSINTTSTSSTDLTFILAFPIVGLLLLAFLGGWLIKKQIHKRKQGIIKENVLYQNSEEIDDPLHSYNTTTNENRYEEPTSSNRTDEIASTDEMEHHIYEELLIETAGNEYENTRHDVSQELLPNSNEYINPNNAASKSIYENNERTHRCEQQRPHRYENINHQEEEAQSPLLNDENGYLMPMKFTELNRNMPTDSYGYMEIEQKTTRSDSLKS